MTFANTSESRFAFVEETTWGTTPATPAFKKVRLTGESLEYAIQNQASNEIRPDADVSDLIQLGASANGALNFELSYGSEMNTLLEHALRGAFSSSRLDAGTLRKSLTFEKKFEVGSPDEFFRFPGLRIGQFSLNLTTGSPITGSFNVMGKSAVQAQAEVTGATYTDANTNDVMSPVDVGSLSIGGVSGTFYLTDLSLQLNNNLRAQNAIGNLEAVGIGYGLREITGSLTAYFSGITRQLHSDFVAGNAGSISFQATDGTNTYTFTLPRIKFQQGRVLAGGNSQDVMAEMNFQALYDTTEQTSIYVNN